MKGCIALAALAAMALGVAVPAPSVRADTVLFNPTGGGFGGAQASNIFSVSSFGYDNGNALAIGGQTAVNNFLAGSGPTTFQIVFQSVLGAVNATNTLGNTISINPNLPVPPTAARGDISINNAGGTQILNTLQEVVLRGTFTEQVVGVSVNGGFATATFALAPVQAANSITLAVQPSGTANESTGTGFAGGTAILNGTVVPSGFGSTFTSSFTVPTTGIGSAASPVLFDQYSQTGYTSPWGNQQSVSGTGSSNFQVAVSSVNSSYFQGNPVVIGLSFNPISQSLPFGQEPPATSFWTGVSSLGTLGAINGGGAGPNIQFQTTGTNNFFTVPEPSTLAMAPIAIGFVSVAGLWTRRRRNAR